MSQLSPALATALLATAPSEIVMSYTDPWLGDGPATVTATSTMAEAQCDVCGPTGGITPGAPVPQTADWWTITDVADLLLVVCPGCCAEQLASPEVHVERVTW